MIRLRSTRTAPPNGFIVSPPLVKEQIQSWSYGDVCGRVKALRPELTMADINQQVENQNALRCLAIGANSFVFIDEQFSSPGLRVPAPSIPSTRPHIPVTLLAVDTTPKAHLAARAIERCLEQATYDDVKLLTTDMGLPHAVKIDPVDGHAGYSRFCIQEMHKYVETSHALVVQWDGYVLNSAAWNPGWLQYDWIASPWQPSKRVGNGGFSLRSKRLMLALSRMQGAPHPEDAFICLTHASELLAAGMKLADYPVASKFSFEGRTWNGTLSDWEATATPWNGQFGFHSFLTALPTDCNRPLIFHHSGDIGDLIYALPVIKAKGGGVLFISPDNRYSFPARTRARADSLWAENIIPLLNAQPYIWKAMWTPRTPYCCDYDLNQFRQYYQRPGFDKNASLWALNRSHWGLRYDESDPWLTVDRPNSVKPIVIGRSGRYHNESFPWDALFTQYGRDMIFVGTDREWNEFGAVPFHRTSNLLELARVIAGAKVFIGNQSGPLAIALGLGKNVITEAWPANPNCNLHRQNQIHWLDGPLDIPEEWLK